MKLIFIQSTKWKLDKKCKSAGQNYRHCLSSSLINLPYSVFMTTNILRNGPNFFFTSKRSPSFCNVTFFSEPFNARTYILYNNCFTNGSDMEFREVTSYLDISLFTKCKLLFVKHSALCFYIT